MLSLMFRVIFRFSVSLSLFTVNQPPLSGFPAVAPGYRSSLRTQLSSCSRDLQRQVALQPLTEQSRSSQPLDFFRTDWLAFFFPPSVARIIGHFEPQDEPNGHRIPSGEMPVYKNHQGKLSHSGSSAVTVHGEQQQLCDG
ncbi:hypothetical protein ILYODFUR_029329 [Ilyodon furcidens]|uniref:Secreted protein n=1 Tax=Ilyodon furcidens TaxID=33524 RepID=A0ABV0V722_9TELE